MVIENHFSIGLKIRQIRNQEFKLSFDKVIYTLAYQTKYLHVRKLIFHLIKNISLDFPCLEIQRKLIQTKVY